jgi:hypothetical protein
MNGMKIIPAFCIRIDNHVFGRFLKEEDAEAVCKTENDSIREKRIYRDNIMRMARVEQCFVLEVQRDDGGTLYFDLQMVSVAN